MSQNAYQQGLDKNAANYVPLSPLSFIERTAMVYPTRTSVVHGTLAYTWSQTYERCRRLASALVAHGVGKGDTVACMLPNVPPMFEAPPSQTRFSGIPPLPGASTEPTLRPGSALFSHAPDAFTPAHWTAPGDVVIEDRTAAHAEGRGLAEWGSAPSPEPLAAHPFTPAPPVEARRGPPRARPL